MGNMDEKARPPSKPKRRRRRSPLTRPDGMKERGTIMDVLREFLEDLKRQGYAQGNLLGLFNVLIGRRIARSDGTLLANGITWRALAEWLKKIRWDKEAVRELGIDPARLPPRDRERYWYLAIVLARVDSAEATQAGDRLAEKLQAAGYVIGPAPK